MALLKAVELRGPDKRSRRLMRQSGTWLQDGQDADAAGNTVADALSTLVAETVVPLSSVPSPSEPAVLEWTLELEGKTPIVVSVGRSQLWRGVKVRQVRLGGSALLFFVAEARLAPLFDAL